MALDDSECTLVLGGIIDPLIKKGLPSIEKEALVAGGLAMATR